MTILKFDDFRKGTKQQKQENIENKKKKKWVFASFIEKIDGLYVDQ